MTRKKRYLFSYLLLALALVVLFAANLFWGSVALTPGAVLAALTGRGGGARGGGGAGAGKYAKGGVDRRQRGKTSSPVAAPCKKIFKSP